ncbi:peptidase M50 [Flammeovirgaceae bacterium 311]|nr:peptidase M50 [Flammeovirgaceae bacterium 311]
MDQAKKNKRLLLHLTLFVVTLITTTLAGAEWRYMYRVIGMGEEGGELSVFWRGISWSEFATGFAFSLPFLSFLTVHEFGHYFTARAHKIRVSLPYFIPFWFAGFMPAIGTMGAVIRIRQYIQSRKVHFDIGIAGPLAGFVIALGVLAWGFTHLPPQDYILQVHPEYRELGAQWQEEANKISLETEGSFYLGKNLLYVLFEKYLASDPERIPSAFEIIHYPWLFAGFLGLFFTALNLLPIGQLDGGHILYGLLGYNWHRRIATALFVALVFWSGLGIPTPDPDEGAGGLLLRLGVYGLFLYYLFGRLDMPASHRLTLVLGVMCAQLMVGYLVPGARGYLGWMLYAFLIGRFIGVYHPVTPEDHPLSTGRKALGWLALLIFVLCFSPEPFVFVE